MNEQKEHKTVGFATSGRLTPAQLRHMVPLRAPRMVTLACWPWVPVLCAAVDGYSEALFASLRIVE